MDSIDHKAVTINLHDRGLYHSKNCCVTSFDWS